MSRATSTGGSSQLRLDALDRPRHRDAGGGVAAAAVGVLGEVLLTERSRSWRHGARADRGRSGKGEGAGPLAGAGSIKEWATCRAAQAEPLRHTSLSTTCIA